MRAGTRRDQITIQTRSQSVDSAGGVVDGWATLRTVWVEQRSLSGTERILADREEKTIATEWWGVPIDWADVTNVHRVLIGTEHHNIRRIDRSRPGSTLITTEYQP